jgi:cyclic pyranopterin phosphate synthase
MYNRLEALRLAPADGPNGNGPAKIFRIPGAQGTVGFISPAGEHFCVDCNRIRLTSDGKLRACLFSNQEVDVKLPLRGGIDLDEYFMQVLSIKPEKNELSRTHSVFPRSSDITHFRAMSQIGG